MLERNGRRRDPSVVWMVVIGGFAVGTMALFVSRAATLPDGGVADGSEFATQGLAASGGVVVEGSEIAMGQVPLNVTVTPTWTLVNESAEAVSLGEPHASVIEGCCPGPLTLSSSALAPGESAQLSFPLEMHPGMDGPHRFDIHVPVGVDGEYLTLEVTGDFG